MLSYVLGGFLIGTLIASITSQAALFPWITLSLTAVVFVFFERRVRTAFIVLLICAGAGAYWFQIADSPTPLENFVEQEVKITGYVDDEFRETGNGAQFYFQIVTLNDEPLRERILVRTERWPEYEFSTPLTLSGTLELPWSGDEFDYRAYLKRYGVRVLMQRPEIRVVREVHLSVWEFMSVRTKGSLLALRNGMERSIEAGVPEPASAYLNGIILGVREDLPAHITDAFSKTGTTHVLAISGYNVAIVAQGFMLLCLRILDRRRAVWLAVAGIVAFTILTGASASVVRAAIMGSLVLVAQSWGKNVHALNLILIAAVGMVLFNPYVLVFDIGYQLSFAAVLGLVYLSPWFERIWSAPARLKGTWSMTVATGAANIATLPLILFHFGTFPVYSLPANVMILPLVPYAMAWGTLGGIASWFWPAVAGIAGIPAWALATWQLTIVQWFSKLPWASVAMPLAWSTVLLVYAALVAIYIRYGNRKGHHSIT